MKRSVRWISLLTFVGAGMVLSFQNCAVGKFSTTAGLNPVAAVQQANGDPGDPPVKNPETFELSHWHGINTDPSTTEADLDRIHQLGFNLIRLNMNRMPLMNRMAPYAFNEAAFARMKLLVDACAARGMKVVIDPHTTPGTEKPTTTLPKDKLWVDPVYQQLLVKLWDRLSKEYSGNPAVAGYDLMNEPSIPRILPPHPTALSWNALAAELVQHVRKNDQKTPIIIESALTFDNGVRLNRIDSLKFLQLPQDDNLIVSVHVYIPPLFTAQGVHGHPIGVKYPGQVDGKYWDRSAIMDELMKVRKFETTNHVGVFIGEFSASRCGDPVSTDQYLTDLLGIFTDFKWAWAYLSYRGADVWSLEEPASPPCGVSDTGAPTRVELFTNFLKSVSQF